MCLGAAVSEILSDFLNFHIWAWNLEFEETSQSCICTLSFYHRGNEIRLIFARRATVFEIRANFQNFHIWAWNLEFEERSQSCTCTLFLCERGEIKLIFALWAAVFKIRADFQNFHICAWNLQWEDRPQSFICTLFLPRGSKLSLFLLHGQPISRYGHICKISIFGYAIWNLKKGAKVAYVQWNLSLRTPEK